jgi:undecaprenyl-diphosphatase
MTFAWFDLFRAFGLGVVAGLTEFVPVSASGHLVFVQRLLGFDESGFGGLTALARLGALMALVSIYFVRIWRLVTGIPGDPAACRFAVGLVVAVLPAGVVGALAHDVIAGALANLWIVCFALIVGGAALLWIDQLDLKPRQRQAGGFSLPMCLAIGIAQCLAVIPGVSRSGASIVAALLLGADRRAATEFSLWLAMPTLAGVLAYDLYGSRGQIHAGAAMVAIGFATSFLAAWLMVQSLLDHVSRDGFKLFAWWRVIVGTLGLIALAIGH